MAAVAVVEDELAKVRSTAGEIELDELAGYRREQFRLAAASRLRRRNLLAGDRTLDPEPLAWLAAVVDHVAPDERVRLCRPQALVGEDAHERGVLRVKPGADRLDRLRCAGVDRLGAALVERIEGDYLNVVGLPAALLIRLLAGRFGGIYGFG